MPQYKDELREVLESKFAIYVLLLIKEQSEDPSINCNKTTIFTAEKGNERTKFLRIKDLMKVGLVERDISQINHNTIYLKLTPKGNKVACLLESALEA